MIKSNEPIEDINKSFVVKAINENFVKVVDTTDKDAVEFNIFILTPMQARDAERRCYESGNKTMSNLAKY